MEHQVLFVLGWTLQWYIILTQGILGRRCNLPLTERMQVFEGHAPSTLPYL